MLDGDLAGTTLLAVADNADALLEDIVDFLESAGINATASNITNVFADTADGDTATDVVFTFGGSTHVVSGVGDGEFSDGDLFVTLTGTSVTSLSDANDLFAA